MPTLLAKMNADRARRAPRARLADVSRNTVLNRLLRRQNGPDAGEQVVVNTIRKGYRLFR